VVSTKSQLWSKTWGVLSPIMFNIYVDDLIGLLSASGCGCHVGRAFRGCIMYADDLLIL
jgi:hypothetical protein